jgi:glycyl-tRNA synthetase
MQYVDQANGNEKYLPYVIETSVGADRCLLAIMCDAYRLENAGDPEKERSVMKFHPSLAPIKAAIMPLSKKPELEEISNKLFADVSENYKAEYDLSGSIGKRYRRQDEIGTPYCLTVDFDTLNDHCITVRSRDTMTQERIAIAQVGNYLKDKFKF